MKVPRIPRVARLVAVISMKRALLPFLFAEGLNSGTRAETSHIVINAQKKKVTGSVKIVSKNLPKALILPLTELI